MGERGGEGRGGNEIWQKYDCVGQNLAHASTAHALNLLSCVQYRHRVRYRVVFCF